MRRVLFVTWDGASQTYLESLFFPIFSRLRARGVEVGVFQHSWAAQRDIAATRNAAERHSIWYEHVTVSATLRRHLLPAFIVAGGPRIVGAARRFGADTLFPRSLIPAAMARVARRIAPELRLVFDADGFMADERVDFGGLSASSAYYRLLRDVEAETVRASEAVITRTNRARDVLLARAGAGTTRAKIFVVPNGKDATQFAPVSDSEAVRIRRQSGVPDSAPWVVHVGSLGPQYLPEKLLAFVEKLQRTRPDTHLNLVTRDVEQGNELVQRRSLRNVRIAPALPRDVPALVAAADLGLAFRSEAFSQLGVSPIKVAEYLLCGTRVIASPVGDLAEQLAGCRGALVLDGVRDDLSRAVNWFAASMQEDRSITRAACRECGITWFDLDRCASGLGDALAYSGAPVG